MSAPPKVSVLLANWNGGRFLNEAVENVVRQTFEDWEFIIVDTGSDDESLSILQRWAAVDKRIKPLYFPSRLLCPTALNFGLATAAARLIARIESDDIWYPERLATQVAYLEESCHAGVGVCGSDAVLIDEIGRPLGVKRYPRRHEACLRAIWYRNPFCHSAVLTRREVFDTCGGYDPGFYHVEDLELWFRVGRRWKLTNLPRPLVGYRVWRGSLTTRRLRKLAWLSWRVRLRAARDFPYRMPLSAHVYSVAALAAAFLPALLARRLFDWALSLFSHSREYKEAGVCSRREGERRTAAHAQWDIRVRTGKWRAQ